MDFIEDFVKATANMPSPERLRRWTAIAVVSAAATRRVWTCIEDDLKLFPNMFIFLVAPPGVGKTRAMDVGKRLLLPLKHLHFSPDEVTRQRVIEQMGEIFLASKREGSQGYLSLISEWATFMPEADKAWMQAIARIWDCPDLYEKQIKTGERTRDYVVKPYFTMIAGCQPSWFAEGFPPSSYEMGLPARIFFIWGGEKPKPVRFRKREQVKDQAVLLKDVVRIAEQAGEVPWDEDAQAAFVAWEERGYSPTVDDPLLLGYNTRRDMHAGKLSLIVALSRGHKTIQKSDFHRALAYMQEAEVEMPTALQNAGGNVYKAQEEAVVQYIQAEWLRERRPVAERWVRRRLGQLVPTTIIGSIINELLAQGRIKTITEEAKAPNRLLKPGAETRRPFNGKST